MSKDYTDLEWLTNNVTEFVKQAYDKGYKQGYQEGFKTADECYDDGIKIAERYIRKIVSSQQNGGMSTEQLSECFGENFLALGSLVFEKYTLPEIIQKIQEYEKNFKAGDEVESIYGTNIGKKYVITKVVNQDYANVMAHDGEVGFINPANYKKTGKHFDLTKILK